MSQSTFIEWGQQVGIFGFQNTCVCNQEILELSHSLHPESSIPTCTAIRLLRMLFLRFTRRAQLLQQL